jgi:DNA-directed RNA polymerase specialized sigma24 family protein
VPGTYSRLVAADEFNAHRPLLFSIAYRMVGTVMEAEDIPQEAFLCWQRAPLHRPDLRL